MNEAYINGNSSMVGNNSELMIAIKRYNLTRDQDL